MGLTKSRRLSKKIWALFAALVLVGLIEAIVILWQIDNPNDISKRTAGQSKQQAKKFNKQQYLLDQAGSLWAVVNKGRNLPSSYVPKSLVTPNITLRLKAGSAEMYLRSDAAKALAKLDSAASSSGVKLMLASGYRSFGLQTIIYNKEVKTYGIVKADTQSARPGHSEHQTGLAADIEPASRRCEIQVCFASLTEGKWLAANAYKHGFIIRYPSGKESLTGYRYEPWHIRYVGAELAGQLNKTGQTLEQFFGLPVYISYPADSIELKS